MLTNRIALRFFNANHDANGGDATKRATAADVEWSGVVGTVSIRSRVDGRVFNVTVRDGRAVGMVAR